MTSSQDKHVEMVYPQIFCFVSCRQVAKLARLCIYKSCLQEDNTRNSAPTSNDVSVAAAERVQLILTGWVTPAPAVHSVSAVWRDSPRLTVGDGLRGFRSVCSPRDLRVALSLTDGRQTPRPQFLPVRVFMSVGERKRKKVAFAVQQLNHFCSKK